MNKAADKQRLLHQILPFKPRSGDLRRMVIVEAVIDSIAADGIHHMTSDSVAKRAKMRRSHVAYYFPNYESMIRAAVEFVVATGQEMTVAYLAQEKPGEPSLRAMIRATFDWFERHPKHRSVMEFLNYAGLCDEHFRQLYRRIERGGLDRLESILRGKRSRRGKRTPSAEKTALMIRNHLVGSLIHLFNADPSRTHALQRTQIEDSLVAMAKSYWI